MKRTISVTSNSLFLTEDRPVFVNRVSESFRLEQHQHEFYELSYVSEGRGYHYIEDDTLAVAKGDLFYLPIGVSHVFRPTTPEHNQGRLIVYNCIFNGEFAARLLTIFGADERIQRLLSSNYPDQPWIYIRDHEGALQQTFNRMYEEFQNRLPNYLPYVQAEIIRLLIHMTRGLERNNAVVQSLESLESIAYSSINEIAKKMINNPAESYSAAQIASEAGVSERHFRRLFKERYGMTFIEYLHKCRIEYSCQLLRSTAEPVSIIAQKSGYQDLKFYYKLFKKLTGLSPRAYRMSDERNAL